MSNKEKRIYLDYAAATPLRAEVLQEMENSRDFFANPSALYKEAKSAKNILTSARERIAATIKAKLHEVIFTSSATEANNLAILGFAKNKKEKGKIITTPAEHASIKEPANVTGWPVEHFKLKNGLVDLSELGGKKTENPTLVSFSWGNPDNGALQPANKISSWAKERGFFLHIDASQAFSWEDFTVAGLGANFVTVSSSKIYGPRGIAALVVRNAKLSPIIYGGGQEMGLRSATQEVTLAAGFAKAVELAVKERKKEKERITKLRDKLIEDVLSKIEDVRLVGPKGEERVANHAAFAFKALEGEEIVIRLDEAGIACGTGSACSTSKDEVSPAIAVLGLGADFEKGSLRVTLGRETKEEDLGLFVGALKSVVSTMRDNQI